MSPEVSSAPGMPVEMGEVDRELKKLWIDGDGTMTRASLVNLAVYSEEDGSLGRNTQLVAKLTEEHACRAIVVAAEPTANERRIEAWINAHCHVRGGAKQVCSEQISILMEGDVGLRLPSVLFAHLDTDLPLYLWWQAPLRAPLDPQLWTWVDRVIYDSANWGDFEEPWQLLLATAKEANRRMILCDLNWQRLTPIRLAFAQFFDHPASHHHFATMDEVRIEFGAGFRRTALLLAGWLAAQLNWSDGVTEPLVFSNGEGKKVKVDLQQSGEGPISALRARSGGIEFEVQRARCGDLLEVGRGKAGQKKSHQLLPYGETDLASLVGAELMRGGKHEIYQHAVEKVRPHLGAPN